MRKFWFNSGLSVLFMLLLGWNQGYKLIWPLFGSTNQLLAALSLIAVTVWLHRAGRRTWITLVPALVMIATTIASLTYYLFVKYLPTGNILLATTDLVLLGLSLGVLVLSVHDSFIVQEEHEELLLGVMRQAFMNHCGGFEPVIEKKGAKPMSIVERPKVAMTVEELLGPAACH